MVAIVGYTLILLWNQHSRLPLLVFIAFFITIAARPQTNTTIHRDFDNEMAHYSTTSPDTTFLSTVLSPIPPWIKGHFPEQEDTLYVLGISDPGLQDSIACKQAILRALALGAMAYGTECDHFSDFYSQEQKSGTDSKYEEIYRFSSFFSDSIPTPTILKDVILSSSEAVVLIGIPLNNLPDDLTRNFRIEAILYNNEADIIYGNTMSTKVDISIQKRNTDEMIVMDANSFYQMNGKATGLRCTYPQSQAIYNRCKFYYSTGDSIIQADETTNQGITCKQGLWIAYVSQILEQLSMQAKLLNKESMVLRDKTKDNSRELLRERSRIRLTWRIEAIDIYENKMWVNLTTSTF